MKPLISCRRLKGVAVMILLATATAHAAAPREAPLRVIRFTGSGAPLGTSADGTLNPLVTYQHLYLQLQHQVFESLVAVDFNSQEIVPALAVSWNISDATTIRFELRHGVRFHNGEPFTAEAVKFSLDLLCDPRSRFAGRFLLDAIAQVSVADAHTVVISLKYPDAVLLRKLACIGMIFPPGYFRKVSEGYFTDHTMGTGPFRYFYTDTSPDGYRQLHLIANEDYWNIGYPLADELIYCFIPFEQQMAALRRGAVDMVITQDSSPDSLQPDDGSVHRIRQQTLRSSVCLFNVDRKGPLDDRRVRQALQMSIDRGQIIERALSGFGFPLQTVAPPGIFDRGGNEPAGPPLDREAACRLLREAGWAEGLCLRLLATDTPNTVRVVREMERQLAEVGVRIEAAFWGRKKILDEIVAPKLRGEMAPSRFDLWVVTGWPHFFGTGVNFYFMFCHPSGLYNFGTFLGRETALSRLYDRVTRSSGPAAFKEHLAALEQFCLDEALLLPLYQSELLYAMRPGIRYAPGLNDMPHRLWQCTVDPDGPAETSHPGLPAGRAQ